MIQVALVSALLRKLNLLLLRRIFYYLIAIDFYLNRGCMIKSYFLLFIVSCFAFIANATSSRNVLIAKSSSAKNTPFQLRVERGDLSFYDKVTYSLGRMPLTLRTVSRGWEKGHSLGTIARAAGSALTDFGSEKGPDHYIERAQRLKVDSSVQTDLSLKAESSAQTDPSFKDTYPSEVAAKRPAVFPPFEYGLNVEGYNVQPEWRKTRPKTPEEPWDSNSREIEDL